LAPFTIGFRRCIFLTLREAATFGLQWRYFQAPLMVAKLLYLNNINAF